jgi:hypothetical protein
MSLFDWSMGCVAGALAMSTFIWWWDRRKAGKDDDT